ncbi:hypothetical protein PISMIDRAFT_685722 [Pisolithus microcarpus 441]|uniref:Uncharacterized protein n=1 Tax=Pisolithus microcarpus 441 TaxID=765257 RepID=A0A0C9YKB1_9AGAM|nr:hypothetical protein PISMIDRAFT_685722 [Pisolithus microcarpus 441]
MSPPQRSVQRSKCWHESACQLLIGYPTSPPMMSDVTRSHPMLTKLFDTRNHRAGKRSLLTERKLDCGPS